MWGGKFRLLSFRTLFAVSLIFFVYSLFMALRWQHCKVVHWVKLSNDDFLNNEGGDAWYKLRQQQEAMAVYFVRLRSLEATCEAVQHVQRPQGPLAVCTSDHFILVSPCIVFAFNIHQGIRVENELADKFNCVVNVFDPLLEDITPQRHPKLNTFRFALSHRNTDRYQPPQQLLFGTEARQLWGLRTYSALLTEASHNGRVVDLVKISIAGLEYDVISQMLRLNQLRSVKQLLVDFYSSSKHKSDYFQRLNILITLHRHGFRIFYTGSNDTLVPCTFGLCHVNTVGFINIYHDM